MKAEIYELYRYRQNEIDHPGPYFGVQIHHMVLAGIIHADAVIEPAFGEGKLPVVSFLKGMNPEGSSVQDVLVVGLPKENFQTIVKNIEMPMGSMVEFMVKWAIATIPTAVLIGIIAFVIKMVSAGIVEALSH